MYIFGVYVCGTQKCQKIPSFPFVFTPIEVDTRELQSSASEVVFAVSVNERDAALGQLFCCLYKSQEGCFSAFSPYLKLERQGGLCVSFKDKRLDGILSRVKKERNVKNTLLCQEAPSEAVIQPVTEEEQRLDTVHAV